MRMRILLVPCAALALTVGIATATAGGGNSGNAKACQKGGWQTLYRSDGSSFKNQGDCVSYAAHGGTLSSARLVLTTDTYGCGGTCWGIISGSGLAPGAAVHIYAATPISGEFLTGAADASGNFGGDTPATGGIWLSCGSSWTGVYATSTLPGGATITSNVVDTPCG